MQPHSNNDNMMLFRLAFMNIYGLRSGNFIAEVMLNADVLRIYLICSDSPSPDALGYLLFSHQFARSANNYLSITRCTLSIFSLERKAAMSIWRGRISTAWRRVLYRNFISLSTHIKIFPLPTVWYFNMLIFKYRLSRQASRRLSAFSVLERHILFSDGYYRRRN